MPSFPQSHFPRIEVDQVVAATTIFELLHKSASGHPLVVLSDVAQERKTIFGEFSACTRPVAGQLRVIPEVAVQSS